MSLPAKSNKFVTLLGIDPGKTNCAFSVVRIKLTPFKYKVMAHGMIKNPVNELTGGSVALHGRYNKFKSEIRKLKRTFKVDAIFAERFMTRGGSSMGTTIEVVSIMLCLLSHVGVKTVQLFTAAQWKNQWNKHNDLKEFYKSMHPMPAHSIDATGIALYGATQLFPEEVPCFEALEDMEVFRKQLLTAYKEPLKNESRRNNSRKNKSRAAPKRTTATTTKRAQKASTRTTKQKPKSRRASTRTRATPTAPQRQSAKTKQRGRQSTKAATGRRTVRKERATKRGT